MVLLPGEDDFLLTLVPRRLSDTLYPSFLSSSEYFWRRDLRRLSPRNFSALNLEYLWQTQNQGL
jgi:hypothetical protein